MGQERNRRLDIDGASGVPSFARDTRPTAERLQTDVYRRMEPAQRYTIGTELSDSVRDIALAGLRERLHGATERALLRRYVFELWGVSVRE